MKITVSSSIRLSPSKIPPTNNALNSPLTCSLTREPSTSLELPNCIPRRWLGLKDNVWLSHWLNVLILKLSVNLKSIRFLLENPIKPTHMRGKVQCTGKYHIVQCKIWTTHRIEVPTTTGFNNQNLSTRHLCIISILPS